MSLKLADVHRIAHLARIEITDAQAQETADQLNDILAMIERIGRVDTNGIVPMSHPLDGVQVVGVDRQTIKSVGRNGDHTPALDETSGILDDVRLGRFR